MEVHNTKFTAPEVLIKSEKTPQKNKIRIVWAISALLVIITLCSFIIDYSGYKKGQEYGFTFFSNWPFFDCDTYAEKCNYLDDRLDPISSQFDLETSEAFKLFMSSAGYHEFTFDWFEYANFAEFFSGYYWNKILPICCYLVLIFSIVFTIFVSREAKKELIVYKDSVLCRVNPQKSKQLCFEDINNVDFGKNCVKLVGTGLKFKISNLTNAESIKTVIVEKKKEKSDNLIASEADELRKYKELLDMGVITQEEFDAKKKQLLGL